MHSICIVAVKYKHFSISGRSPTGEIKKIISLCSFEHEHHILEWTLTELVSTLKDVFEQKFLWFFIDCFYFLFIFYTRNSHYISRRYIFIEEMYSCSRNLFYKLQQLYQYNYKHRFIYYFVIKFGLIKKINKNFAQYSAHPQIFLTNDKLKSFMS